MKINIKNNTNYSDIENNYGLLNKYPNADLYIPANLKGKQLGIYTEIIQLIITWSRISKGRLYVHYNKDSSDLDDKIELMFNRFWNFVAGCMGYKNGIYLLDETNISSKVASVIKKRIDFLSINKNWKKGNNSFISAIQHSANPFPSALYYSNGNLKSKKQIIELTKDILIDVSKTYSKSTSTTVVEHYQELIGEIIFELIENTHFWSQSNHEDKTFETGVRGLMISSHHGNKKELLKNCKDDKSLYQYFTNLISNSEAENQVIELSIFDSGSGLAGRWLQKEITELNTTQEIYDAIIDCLIKENTTDKSSNYERGFGLFNMMKLLDLRNGYLKIRTNGLKLVRDFNKNPFDANKPKQKEEYKLENWYDAQKKSIPNFKTEGTMFSIFLPTSETN
tara:strand:+ start:13086 stop:14270 length:1185 start_codon:yes stop_codon:yes gene_type:complete